MRERVFQRLIARWILRFGENEIDRDGTGMHRSDCFQAAGQCRANFQQAAERGERLFIGGKNDGFRLPGRGLVQAEEEIVRVVIDLLAEGGPTDQKTQKQSAGKERDVTEPAQGDYIMGTDYWARNGLRIVKV